MATLDSPGVQVQVIDESFYTPSAPGTVPLIFVTSAQDKTNPSGSIALGTTAANAGKVWLITSQRDLTDTFGTPVFYTDSSGNPQHGNELNEYGLQAAYSVLGASSRAYIVRADVDMTDLLPSSSEPTGEPVAGTYWVDTDASLYGISEWNSTTLKFTNISPIVLNDDSDSNLFSGSAPSTSLGQIGNYCLVLTNANAARLYYKTASNIWAAVIDGFDGGKNVTIAPHFGYPAWGGGNLTGSVWIKTTTPAQGANWSVKSYNSTTDSWNTNPAPLYDSVRAATFAYDTTNGGKNIPVGSLFVETNYEHDGSPTATFKLWRRNATGKTVVSSTSPSGLTLTTLPLYEFEIRETTTSSNAWSSVYTVSISPASTTTTIASLIPAALSASGVQNVTASYEPITNRLTFTHELGGDFQLGDSTGGPISACGFTAYNVVTKSGTANLYAAVDFSWDFLATNWKPLSFEARNNAPTTAPADGTLWYDTKLDVDIMYHDGTTWVGYATAFLNTDPAGPTVSVIEPTTQSDGSPLAAGDIWISTENPDQFGRVIYVHNGADWVLQDVTDQSTPDGWLFADARWGTSGSTLEAGTLVDLRSSNYVDPDCPDPALYPRGMRLWNTRRSGFNIKKYVSGYININANNGQNIRFGNQSMTTLGSEYESDRWVSQYPVAEDGGPQFGRLAQRAQTVNALKEMIDSNATIRDTDTLNFNLIATPGYPEAIQNMVAFNTDRGLTAFVIGDTPFRLLPTGTALSAWGLNTNRALDNSDDGAVTYDEYMAMYYPSGYTNDNTGNRIVVPPSHMMLRTFINSDAKSYQWFAPAGTRRGTVDNATSVGYIDGEGEFKPVALHQSLRDVLNDPKIAINPIATLPGAGILAYGQRTRARNASSLDRINVARLVCYLRRQLDVLARPFLFEPNDAQTRREIKAAAESLMLELVGQRALYDFIVVCDETNNTPARIDRSELYMDIAIEPVKAVEFIYIPLRLKNTGDIAAGL
jgi:hypothetical protein